jgi:hypothetical protein
MVGLFLHLSSPAYPSPEQRTQIAGTSWPPGPGEVTEPYSITWSGGASLAEAKMPRPRRTTPGVPELLNFCVAGAETSPANSIGLSREAEGEAAAE